MDKKLQTRKSQLGRLLVAETNNTWAIGDLLIDLVENFDQTIMGLADEFNWSRPRLNEIYLAAKAFPPETRRTDQTFYQHEVVRHSVTKSHFEGTVSEAFDVVLNPPPAIIAKIEAATGQTPNPKEKRGATRILSAVVSKIEADKAKAKGPVILAKSEGLLNRAYHTRWEDFVDRINVPLDLVIADPPYGYYSKTDDGKLCDADSACRTHSDNKRADEAIATTVPLFEKLADKMAPGGVLLLWQAGAKPLRVEIQEAALRHGWDSRVTEMVWIKGRIGDPEKDEDAIVRRVKPTNFAFPVSISSEKMAIFFRAGDTIRNRDDTPRGEFMIYQPVSMTTANFLKHHQFEKPLDLAEFIIRKFSDAGQVVYEPFGCSGAFSRAAAKLGRSWIYTESNAESYRWFSEDLLPAEQLTMESA